MSLEQAIKHKKEYRKPYYGAKSIDSTCRNHGSCIWCKRNRLHKNLVLLEKMEGIEKNE